MMNIQIIFATKNKGKIKEIKRIFQYGDTSADYDVISMEEAGIDINIVEDGTTFEQNAIKKAMAIADYIKSDNIPACGKICKWRDGFVGEPAAQPCRDHVPVVVMADDSGLEIDFMDKKPGVHSARFLGEDTPYAIKNNLILDMMKDVPPPERTGRYVCVIAAALPDGRVLTAHAALEGVIAHQPRGDNGFGYDPIFFNSQHEMTLAEMDADLKNRISHRGLALHLMKEKLIQALTEGLDEDTRRQ